MDVLVLLLWCVYLSDCFVRQQPRNWTFRDGLGKPMHGIDGPDAQLLGERFGFAWTPLLPWQVAYSFGGDDLDVKAAQRRLNVVARETRWLKIASGFLFAWVMVLLPALILSHRFPLVALPWLAVGIPGWGATLALFVRAYRRVHRTSPTFETWLTSTLSPVALMRSPSTVSFAALGSVHPLAGAAALCDDGEFLRIARLWHFDDEHRRDDVERIAKGRGLLDKLAAGPEVVEPGVAQFCPRCHRTYLAGAAQCADCPEVPLRPLTGFALAFETSAPGA